MDVRGWKKVIFAWVQKCGFVDENVLTLEQSNINKFFEHFLEYDHMHLSLDTTDSTHSNHSSRYATPLLEFLKTVYPDFGPHLDRSGNLDRSDYLLVYTLMLHYACVIEKSEKYQLKCTELSEPIQKAIASFLSRIVDSRKITRLCLREALETTTKLYDPGTPPVFVHPRPAMFAIACNASISSSDPETLGTPVTAITESPQTPQETPLNRSSDEYSPLPICSTPMRERERVTVFEWRQVIDRLAATEIKLAEMETKLTSAERKLLSTESEYSTLDELFQEVTKSKANLQNANKELKAEIAMLKEKVKLFEERASDEDADGQSNFEHFKQGYVKEIIAKDTIIAEINELLQDAMNARVKEDARVRQLEEQLKECFDQISMLTLIVKQDRERLSKKDLEIICLERDKQDLTQCLNVLRQESQGRREVLNASSDMLDTSLSPGSVPENLASCVVDKQLREKEQEICQLKEEFATLQSNIYELINAEVKVEPLPKSISCFKDQKQLLKAICDALIIGPQASTEYEAGKLHKEIEILRTKLHSEKDTMANMYGLHDRECLKMSYKLAFVDEDLDKEKQILAEQQKRILETQQRLDSLALAKKAEPEVAEKDQKQLDELQHQLDILETELSQMSSQKLNNQNCILNYLEDEKANDEMSKQSLEETKRLKQQINTIQITKRDLLDKKESEIAELKDQIAVLQQQMKDEEAKGRLQAPERKGEHDQLVKERNVLAITSREQSQRLALLHDWLEKLELARKKKEVQIENENHDSNSEIAHYYARELQELENKCNFTMQKCDQVQAEAAEQADKLAHVLQRIEQIQYENERSIEEATTKQERAAQTDSDSTIYDCYCKSDLIAEKDAKIAELTVDIVVLKDQVDSLTMEKLTLVENQEILKGTEEYLANEQEKLTASLKEHQTNASKLQQSLKLLAAEKSQLEKNLAKQVHLLQDVEKSNELLLVKLDSQQENDKNGEQRLKDLHALMTKKQAEHSDIILKLELGIDQWREKYENIEKESSAQKEMAKSNERKHQEIVQEHKRTISKLRDDFNTLEKNLLFKQSCCEEDWLKLNDRVILLTRERDTLTQERDTLTQERDTLTQERDNLNDSYATLLKERDNLNDSYATLLKERDTLKATEKQHQMEISRFENMELQILGMLDNTREKMQTLTQIDANANANKENRQLHVESSLRQQNWLEIFKEKLNQKDMQIDALRKEKEVIRKSKRTAKNALHMMTKESDAKEARFCQEIGSLNYQLQRTKQLIQQQESQLKIKTAAEGQAREAANKELQEVREQMLKIETAYAHDKHQLELQAKNLQGELGEILQEKTDLQADLQKHKEQLRFFQEIVQGLKRTISKQQNDFSTLEKNLLLKQNCNEEDRLKLNDRVILLTQERDTLIQERDTLTQERDTLTQERDTLTQERDTLTQERDTLRLYSDTMKQDLMAVAKIHKMEVSRLQEIHAQDQASNENQLRLFHHQLEQSEQRYEYLQVEMTDQQRTSDERLIQLGEQLNAAKKELAEAMERLSATYTAAAEEEGLPDRSTLQRDCQVLQAKYQEAKKKIDELQVNIKDQRNEMEGKLEKMKNKMRTLYTAEVTRMKEKQEREAAHNKAELEAITCQNTKYEEHTRKLSNQIVRLNERILEQQKQHAITTTKLRHMQATSEATKSSSSLSTLTVSGSATTAATATATATSATEDWQPFKRPTAPSSNLAMEDEEGEVFNNTYLTDLKLGRVPDITAEELNYRNSLQPPHLRSTYAAQYDVGSQDEDLKDGPHSLDDSMSALLSSSASTGARKKSMGTHYKRPGPPTPSKNGGRLSFGSSEPPREILRETCENTGTSKTPTRFKMFTSRFSIGSTTSGSSGLPRDERPLRRERPNLLTGMQRRRLQLRQSSGLFCTSTPRKSRSYYDQRRLICASDAISDQVQDEDEEEEEDHEQEPEQEQEQKNVAEELEEEGTPHLSNAALLAITRGVTRRLSNDPRYSSPSSGSTPQFGCGKRKYRKGRVSLCLHGNIFAKSRPLTKITATAHAGNLKQQLKKLKQQRLNRFDQGRHFNESPVAAVTFQQSPIPPTNVTYKLLQPLDRCDNNNYSLHNRNREQQQADQQDQQLQLMMGQTVVLKPEEQILDDGLLPVAATTFNVSETDSTDMWQHRQIFEREHIQAWLTEYTRENENPIEMENEDSHGGHFERLCRETESTAPFELQPLHYKEQEEQPKVRSVRPLNITGTTSVCTTNASCATNLTSASSRKSCTIYSLGHIQSEPLPTMTIMHVEQRVVHQEPRTKTLTLRELWHTFCRLNLSGRLMLSLALALTMMLCSQVADRMALGVTAAFGLLLLILSLSCGK